MPKRLTDEEKMGRYEKIRARLLAQEERGQIPSLKRGEPREVWEGYNFLRARYLGGPTKYMEDRAYSLPISSYLHLRNRGNMLKRSPRNNAETNGRRLTKEERLDLIRERHQIHLGRKERELEESFED